MNMKKLIIILALLLQLKIARTQHLNLSLLAEKTVAGSDYGATLVYENKGQWGVGFFGQTGLSKQNNEEGFSMKNPFYGLTVQAPLVRTEKITFLLNTRAGLVNQNFFIVVPGLETRIHILSRFAAVVGVGLRHGHPSASIKIMTRVF